MCRLLNISRRLLAVIRSAMLLRCMCRKDGHQQDSELKPYLWSSVIWPFLLYAPHWENASDPIVGGLANQITFQNPAWL